MATLRQVQCRYEIHAHSKLMDTQDATPDAAIQRMLANRAWAAARTNRFLIRCFDDLVREFALRSKLLTLGRQHMGKDHGDG